MMENKINEFLKQINDEIKNYEEKLEQCKKALAKDIQNSQFYTLEEFGIAKYAEQITKIAGQLKVLYQQKQRFEFIFKAE